MDACSPPWFTGWLPPAIPPYPRRLCGYCHLGSSSFYLDYVNIPAAGFWITTRAPACLRIIFTCSPATHRLHYLAPSSVTCLTHVAVAPPTPCTTLPAAPPYHPPRSPHAFLFFAPTDSTAACTYLLPALPHRHLHGLPAPTLSPLPVLPRIVVRATWFPFFCHAPFCRYRYLPPYLVYTATVVTSWLVAWVLGLYGSSLVWVAFAAPAAATLRRAPFRL